MNINIKHKGRERTWKEAMTFLPFCLFTFLLLGLVSCSEDDLSDESVINSMERERTPFDDWLDANFLNPYNINFKYLYDESETDMDYYTVPADYDASVIMAHILKYDCLEAYQEVAGVNFVRQYFPKEFVLVGSYMFRNNGTFALGTAEGGKKIILTGINNIKSNMYNLSFLNEYYLHTIHHEFVHILNQTKDFPTSFGQITGSGYVSDKWSEEPYNKVDVYPTRGFVSDYAQSESKEDFAETVSTYLTDTDDEWLLLLNNASKGSPEGSDKTGRELIEEKLQMAKDYYWSNWSIDLDALKASVQRRGQDIADKKIDLTDLTVNNKTDESDEE